MATISPILNIIIKSCEKASKILIRDFGELENLQVSKKGPKDFVTNSDKKVEKILIEELQKARPDYSILSEEIGEINNDSPKKIANHIIKLIDDNSDKIDTSYSEDEIQDLMVEYSNLSLGTDTKGNPIHPKQTDLCSPRLSGQTLDSVAFHITRNVLKDNDGLLDILLENLKDSKGFEEVLGM